MWKRSEDRRRKRRGSPPVAILAFVLALGAPARAYDVNDAFSVGLLLAGAAQCQIFTRDAGADDECGGALAVRPEIELRPTDNDRIYVKTAFAVGDGLDRKSPFNLRHWAADLQDGVRGINGRWDFLMDAWYRHEFRFHEELALTATVGVIDSTDYLEDNAYADDEYGQFMNEAFVDGPQSGLPSHDLGGALELAVGRWSARTVVMGIGENDAGDSFVFYGGQLGYRLETPLGDGNYRFVVVGSSREFFDPTETKRERRLAGALSFDQQLGETFGAFLRIGWQSDRAAVDYDASYSGGLNVRGGAWGREDDHIGLGYAYLSGGNQGLRASHVAEAYYRLAAFEYFGLTADVQYVFDDLRGGGGAHAFILGLRVVVEY